MRISGAAWKTGGPWAALAVLLWAVQVWSIWGSGFSMEMTILQGVFVLAFVVVILLIAQARLDES